jgi:glycosyltransferase involved in cell wall biosynthesis
MGKVKILWVKANKLLPVQSGGDIRSFNIIRQLASRHEITLFSYYDGQTDAAYERDLQTAFPGAVCLSTGRSNGSGWRRGLDYLLRLPGSLPYAVARFASNAVRRRLRQWYSNRAFDVVICDFLDAAVNLPERRSIPTILFQHNVESEIWRRHSVNERNRARRLLYQIEFSRMLGYERRMVSKFARVLAVSEHDRKLMSAWVDASRIVVVPTGVDLEKFYPDPSVARADGLITFVGAMDWEPNVDAVEYFCRQILPRIQACVSGARFRIVGRNPGPRVNTLQGSDVEVTGSVPSIVEHLRASAVVVVPLRVGGGTRLKIYEAMATGKAVVSTSVGAEGLDVENGVDLILADQPEAFAAAVQSLLQDRELRRRYEVAARACANRYSWQAVSEKLDPVLRSVAGEPLTLDVGYVPAQKLEVR